MFAPQSSGPRRGIESSITSEQHTIRKQIITYELASNTLTNQKPILLQNIPELLTNFKDSKIEELVSTPAIKIRLAEL